MANNVIVQVVGGDKKVFDNLSTVADARKALGLSASYRASVQGEPQDDEAQLRAGDYVSFSEAVKGA